MVCVTSNSKAEASFRRGRGGKLQPVSKDHRGHARLSEPKKKVLSKRTLEISAKAAGAAAGRATAKMSRQRDSVAGALQGIQSLSLAYAVAAAALGAAAAAAADPALPPVSTDEVAAAAIAALEEVMGWSLRA
eukprot:s1542_g4.t1